MLHSVRFLQSQWHARSPALTLRDLVEYLRPGGGSSAAIEKARRLYQTARIQCFLRGIAVAVDGPLPTTGALLLGSVSDPEFIVSSVRPSLELDMAELEHEGILDRAFLREQVYAALDAGLLVYVRQRTTSDALGKWLEEQVRARRHPVLAVAITHAACYAMPSSLALSEVVIRLTPAGGDNASFH